MPGGGKHVWNRNGRRAEPRGELDLPRPDKGRPGLTLTRRRLIGLLHTVTVVALTSTLRGAPTEAELGTAGGSTVGRDSDREALTARTRGLP